MMQMLLDQCHAPASSRHRIAQSRFDEVSVITSREPGGIVRSIRGNLLLPVTLSLDRAVAQVRLEALAMEDAGTKVVAHLFLRDLARSGQDGRIAFVLDAAVDLQASYALVAELHLSGSRRLEAGDYRTIDRIVWRATQPDAVVELPLRRIT